VSSSLHALSFDPLEAPNTLITATHRTSQLLAIGVATRPALKFAFFYALFGFVSWITLA